MEAFQLLNEQECDALAQISAGRNSLISGTGPCNEPISSAKDGLEAADDIGIAARCWPNSPAITTATMAAQR